MAGQDMQGRTVLVTGAARGIGAATAERFHARGANVALVGLESERLEERAAALGERAAWFEVDVRDNDAVEAAVAGTVDAFGGIDVAIANAGINYEGFLRDQPIDEWVRIIDVNLLGVYRTTRAVLPHVMDSGGYVLNVASLAAVMHGPPGTSAYVAAKAGIEGFTDVLRTELVGTGATVGTAYFGFVDTDMARGMLSRDATRLLVSGQPRFLRTPIPLATAVDAIERGVERRAPRLWAPWWVSIVLGLRGVLQQLQEVAAGRAPDVTVEASRLAAPQGDASRPTLDPVLGVAVQDGTPVSDCDRATPPPTSDEA